MPQLPQTLRAKGETENGKFEMSQRNAGASTCAPYHHGYGRAAPVGIHDRSFSRLRFNAIVAIVGFNSGDSTERAHCGIHVASPS